MNILIDSNAVLLIIFDNNGDSNDSNAGKPDFLKQYNIKNKKAFKMNNLPFPIIYSLKFIKLK